MEQGWQGDVEGNSRVVAGFAATVCFHAHTMRIHRPLSKDYFGLNAHRVIFGVDILCLMRTIRAMNADETKPTRRQAVNLTLSAVAVRKARRLKKDTQRGSISNVVEWLILEKAKECGVVKRAEEALA